MLDIIINCFRVVEDIFGYFGYGYFIIYNLNLKELLEYIF